MLFGHASDAAGAWLRWNILSRCKSLTQTGSARQVRPRYVGLLTIGGDGLTNSHHAVSNEVRMVRASLSSRSLKP